MKAYKNGIILFVLGGLAAILGGYAIYNAETTERALNGGIITLLGGLICGYGGYIISSTKKD